MLHVRWNGLVAIVGGDQTGDQTNGLDVAESPMAAAGGATARWAAAAGQPRASGTPRSNRRSAGERPPQDRATSEGRMPGASAPPDPPATEPTSPESPPATAPPASALRETRLRPPLPRRIVQLYVGLVLLGSSYGLLVLAGLGLDPWSVLHQGLSRRTGISIGTWAIVVGALVLVPWVLLRQRPGFGTLNNVVVIGLVIDATLALTPQPHGLPARWAYFGVGVLLNGAATGAYIGAGLGPGPRDGLMTGLAARGWSLRVVRTSIELTVLAAGWLLGGTVGLGTLLYALAVGPIVHVSIPALTVRSGEPATGRPGGRGTAPGTGPGRGAPRDGVTPSADP